MLQLRKIARTAVHHLGGYVDLIFELGDEWINFASRRLFAAALAMLLGGCGIVVGCVSIVLVLWESPWRDGVAIGLAAALLLSAVAAAAVALRDGPAPEMRSQLRAQIEMDKALLSRLGD